MAIISENKQLTILNKNNINIRTLFRSNNTTLERNTNNSKNDNISNGIILTKEYYINNKLIRKIDRFDPSIEYTYICNKNENIKCINCGMTGNINDFIDGCPYCGTNYNIDYNYKSLGSKYNYNQITHDKSYKIKTLIIDIIFSFIVVFLYLLITSRTFNIFDISKVILFSLLLSIVLYYFFYIVDAYVIILPIKRQKNKQNQLQKEFWIKNNIDKTKFFNNLNLELKNYYYNNNSNIIDYDIIDYLNFNNRNNCIDANVLIRLIKIDNNDIKEDIIEKTFTMIKSNEKDTIHGGINYIKCSGCGASINILNDHCDYCKKEKNHYQEWYLVYYEK